MSLMTQKQSAPRDDQWQQTEHLLPGGVGTAGVTAKNNRLFVEAVLSCKTFWGLSSNTHSPHATLSDPQIFHAFLRKIVPIAPFKNTVGLRLRSSMSMIEKFSANWGDEFFA